MAVRPREKVSESRKERPTLRTSCPPTYPTMSGTMASTQGVGRREKTTEQCGERGHPRISLDGRCERFREVVEHGSLFSLEDLQPVHDVLSWKKKPSWRYASLPCRSKKICVGIKRTPYCLDASGFFHTSMNWTTALPCHSFFNSSRMGAIFLQGMHLSAPRSISRGSGFSGVAAAAFALFDCASPGSTG